MSSGHIDSELPTQGCARGQNRLSEAFAWELVPDGIQSVATQSGSGFIRIESTRPYIQKASFAEFLRIGGFLDYHLSK